MRDNKFFILFLGFFTMYLVVYRRFIPRLPQEINFSPEKFPILLFSFFFLNTLIISILLMYSLVKKRETTKFLRFHEILKTSREIVIESWYSVYLLFVQFIPNYFSKINYLAKKIFPILVWPNILIIIFKILPRMIITFCFLLDIFYYQKLDYFYKSLIVILLPLIFDCILYLLDTFAKENVSNLENTIIDYTWYEDPIKKKTIINYKLKDNIILDPSEDFVKYAKLHEFCAEMKIRIRNCREKTYILQFLPWITLFFTVIMCICWGYLIFKFYFKI